MERPCFVYVIECLPTGKMYIGISVKPKQRWKSHIYNAVSSKNIKYQLQNAIAKYGVDKFTHTVIEHYSTVKEAKYAEIFWIAYLKEMGCELLNNSPGGEGLEFFVKGDKPNKRLKGDKNYFYGKRLFGKDHPCYGTNNISGTSHYNFGKKIKPHIQDILIKSSTKLSDAQVADMRAKFIAGSSKSQLAKEFNISVSHSHRLINGERRGDKNTPRYNPNAVKNKLTFKIAEEIRSLYKTGTLTQKEIAKQYGIGHMQINRVIKRKAWKDEFNILNKYHVSFETAKAVCKMYDTGKFSQKDISKQFNISTLRIHRILSDKDLKSILKRS